MAEPETAPGKARAVGYGWVLAALPFVIVSGLALGWSSGGVGDAARSHGQPLRGVLNVVVALLVPACSTISAIVFIRRRADRLLVLPPLIMGGVVFQALRCSTASLPAIVLLDVAWLASVVACTSANRALAQWSVLVCGAWAAWIQLAACF